jgi:hypothetical protein
VRTLRHHSSARSHPPTFPDIWRAALTPISAAFFLEYVWPPDLQAVEKPDPIDDWHAGLVGYGVDDIRDIKGRGPLIELKAQNLEQARGEAAEHWQNRTGLDPSEDAPEGYTIWDERGGCKFTYRLPS